MTYSFHDVLIIFRRKLTLATLGTIELRVDCSHVNGNTVLSVRRPLKRFQKNLFKIKR